MEIEKKYLVDKDYVPHGKYVEIEQAYISHKPLLRIRRWDDNYIFTYKKSAASKENIEKININEEIEEEIDKESYGKLLAKCDGIVITKRRYLIPYNDLTVELDIFKGELEGLVIAEVEFASENEAKDFVPPAWFVKDVSGDYHYTNSWLSRNGKAKQ